MSLEPKGCQFLVADATILSIQVFILSLHGLKAAIWQAKFGILPSLPTALHLSLKIVFELLHIIQVYLKNLRINSVANLDGPDGTFHYFCLVGVMKSTKACLEETNIWISLWNCGTINDMHKIPVHFSHINQWRNDWAMLFTGMGLLKAAAKHRHIPDLADRWCYSRWLKLVNNICSSVISPPIYMTKLHQNCMNDLHLNV